MRLYQGPIFDAHHHLWRYRPETHPWIAEAGDRLLARDVTLSDHRAALGGFSVSGSVWIEALAADPVAEAGWAAEHLRRAGHPHAIVAHAALDSRDIGLRLDRLLAAAPTLRGIRDIVAIRPGAPSFARRDDLLASPAFVTGLAECRDRGLGFDLMLEPWQMGAALACLDRVPGLPVIIEHAGGPDFSAPSATTLWRHAMREAAARPTIAVKISALHCRMPDWTDERLAEQILWLVETFGPDRLAFASDFPTHDRSCPTPRAYETFRKAVATLDDPIQRALFHDTARRLYRV